MHGGEERPADPVDADDVLTRRMPGSEAADAAVLQESRRHTRRSFVVAAAGTAAAVGLYHWLEHGPQDRMVRTPLRETLEANAAVSRGVFDDRGLAPTYPLSRAETLRVNGIVGLGKRLEPESYRLQVVGVKDAARHPRFAKDVTAWEYAYTAEKTKEDQGHDTKIDPKLAKAALPPEAADASMADASTAMKMAPESKIGKVQEGREPHGPQAARHGRGG